MRLRIWLVSDSEARTRTDTPPTDEKEMPNDCLPSDLAGNQQPLLDISIHPTKLRRLAKIPQQLPINSLIFTFSDGSIRATATLLDLVGDQDGSHADEHLKDEFGRFGDDVFRTLDQVTPVKKSKAASSNKEETKDGRSDGQTTTTIDPALSEDSNDSAIKQDNNKATQECLFHKELLSGTECTRFEDNEAEVSKKDVGLERHHLERLVQLEEEALNRDLQLLKEVSPVPIAANKCDRPFLLLCINFANCMPQEKSQLGSSISEAGRINNDMYKLAVSIDTERQRCRQSEFFLEARRMKLLRDLRTLYPITYLQGEDRFCCIRDLKIPLDIHSGTIGEEELSAAFGYLCHLVSLISKYLNIQLRYRLFTNSSRSAIQEDGGAIYPLFQARMVEREALDHAVLLLQRNVECILKARGIEHRKGEHVLDAVNRLFEALV
jgi:hypothetical protein